METLKTEADKPPPRGQKNPPDIDSSDLAVAGESEPGGLAKLPGRLTRFAGAKKRSSSMSEHLIKTVGGQEHSKLHVVPNPGAEASESELALYAGSKLANCATWFEFRHYYEIDEVRLHDSNFCQQPKLCPICALRRSARNLASYMQALQCVQLDLEADHLEPFFYMVTLTVKNGPDLTERMSHLRSGVKRLIERRRQALSGNGRGKTEFRKVHGAVGSYEVTNTGKGWHPHVHMVLICLEPLERLALKREWERTTGDSFIIDVQPIGNEQQSVTSAFVEVLKYSMKFQDMSLADNWRAHLELRGVRLLISIGCFRGVKEPDLRDDTLEGQPYESLFYRYLPASGVYSLAGSESFSETAKNRRGGFRAAAARRRIKIKRPAAVGCEAAAPSIAGSQKYSKQSK